MSKKEIDAIINLVDVLLDSRTSLNENQKNAIVLLLQILREELKA
jgi:hypothetical protein